MKNTTTLDRSSLSRLTRKAIDDLHDRHAVGTQAFAATRTRNDKAKYGSSAVGSFARGDGSSDTYIYDVRQFAKTYSVEELEELVALCTKYDVPIGPSHAFELMRVKDHSLRRKLQKQAAINGWSAMRIRREVRARKAK